MIDTFLYIRILVAIMLASSVLTSLIKGNLSIVRYHYLKSQEPLFIMFCIFSIKKMQHIFFPVMASGRFQKAKLFPRMLRFIWKFGSGANHDL